MAMYSRIRTIKPEFFRHLELYQLEIVTELPIRVAYAGLWTVVDREGRFRWQPEILKLDVLPFDNLDFSRVLDALLTRGFLVRYEISKKLYGYIPTFKTHQFINNKEMQSKIPPPPDHIDLIDHSTREPRVSHTWPTRLYVLEGEGLREGEEKHPPTPLPGGEAVSKISLQKSKLILTKAQESLFDRFWEAYPKKLSKGQAEKAWKSINPDEQLLATMIAIIERAMTLEDWKRDAGQYIPYPATWLNSKRWLDEPVNACNEELNHEHAQAVLDFDGREKFEAYCTKNNLDIGEVDAWILTNSHPH